MIAVTTPNGGKDTDMTIPVTAYGHLVLAPRTGHLADCCGPSIAVGRGAVSVPPNTLPTRVQVTEPQV